MNNMIAGATISRSDLIARAQVYSSEPKPYGAQADTSNDSFLGSVERYQGNTIGEIIASADTTAAAAAASVRFASKMNVGGAVVAGLGMLGNFFVPTLPAPVTVGLLVLGLGVEVLGALKITSGQQNEQAAKQFASQAKDWGAFMDAEQAKSQPAPAQPAPAQPAPAQPAPMQPAPTQPAPTPDSAA